MAQLTSSSASRTFGYVYYAYGCTNIPSCTYGFRTCRYLYGADDCTNIYSSTYASPPAHKSMVPKSSPTSPPNLSVSSPTPPLIPSPRSLSYHIHPPLTNFLATVSASQEEVTTAYHNTTTTPLTPPRRLNTFKYLATHNDMLVKCVRKYDAHKAP